MSPLNQSENPKAPLPAAELERPNSKTHLKKNQTEIHTQRHETPNGVYTHRLLGTAAKNRECHVLVVQAAVSYT
jgi:hypothetical protein